jgi:hypothetical protein
MMKHIESPVDDDANVNALLNAYPMGTRFTTDDVQKLLGMPYHRAKYFLCELRDVLTHCPEGIQLHAKRGAHSGHWFIPGRD